MPDPSRLRLALRAAALRFADDLADAFEAHLADRATKPAPSTPRRKPSPTPHRAPEQEPPPEAIERARRALRRAGLPLD